MSLSVRRLLSPTLKLATSRTLIRSSTIPLLCQQRLSSLSSIPARAIATTAIQQQGAAQGSQVMKKTRLGKWGKFFLGLFVLGGVIPMSLLVYYTKREFDFGPQVPHSPTFPDGSPKKNLVILGSGWGSITLLRNLDTSLYNVFVVSPRSYFLFTPLLPSAPVGTVDITSITESVRNIARRTPGEMVYLEAEALSVDPENKSIKARYVTEKEGRENEFDLPYDYLVMGVGSQSTTFNVPGVRENASFLKEIPDAEQIREKMKFNLAKAAHLKKDDPERERLLRFLVVGGGPTGAEVAAEIRDYVDEDLSRVSPDLAKEIKITVIEGHPNILPMFQKPLIDYTEKHFHSTKIDMILQTHVTEVEPKSVTAVSKDGTRMCVPYGVLIWTTGTAPRQITKDLIAKMDPAVQNSKRGLVINERLQMAGAEDSIFALGDCSFYPGLMPTAQVARQEGAYLADLLKKLHRIDHMKWAKEDPQKIKEEFEKIEKFKYHNRGMLAYVGHEKAIAHIGTTDDSGVSLDGTKGFMLWRRAYLIMCVSMRTRMFVMFDWIKVRLFGRDTSF